MLEQLEAGQTRGKLALDPWRWERLCFTAMLRCPPRGGCDSCSVAGTARSPTWRPRWHLPRVRVEMGQPLPSPGFLGIPASGCGPGGEGYVRLTVCGGEAHAEAQITEDVRRVGELAW